MFATTKFKLIFWIVFLVLSGKIYSQSTSRISLTSDWKFLRYSSMDDSLIYDIRPDITDRNDTKVADTKPTDATLLAADSKVLKKYILPSANPFIKDKNKHHKMPEGNPGAHFPFVQHDFNDDKWESVNLPHDWAVRMPFLPGPMAEVGGGMGRLSSNGVAWYRKKITISHEDKNKLVFLDIDGAMSYAMVWINKQLAGGWPYGYNSFRIDLTPYIKEGENQIAIRLDNPNASARWYPGGGLYRNIWLTKSNLIHIAQWGTYVISQNISDSSADINLSVKLDNASSKDEKIDLTTEIHTYLNSKKGPLIKTIYTKSISIEKNSTIEISANTTLKKPLFWGPMPDQKPHLYMATNKIMRNGKILDTYETVFGIRSIQCDATEGLIINGKKIKIKGVNQHHDLGALGAAFNTRAAQRQLEILLEMGCNAIRMSHNPPAPELLNLTDQMGILVMDEIFDSWEQKKTPHDFHLVFPDWYEADIRSFIRRDRNHPSIFAWSFGNEVGEQYTLQSGAAIAHRLREIVKEEDSSRPSTSAINFAKPDFPFTQELDIISLNYQGEGIRDAPAYAHLKGIKTPPSYPLFRNKFSDRMILSSETASTLSTRGTYIFPVTDGNSAPVSDSTGGDPINKYVSAYELYSAQFGSSPDKVFEALDRHPYVAGEFVWTGWDYIGEPTPYYSARSSYSGIIDLAGFKKDRFYLYQSRWRPSNPMAHILPHWSWPDRIGKVTPVHVFTSGDEAELFLNNKSLGIKKKNDYEYRLRWSDVIYEPGELKVISYKNGKKWAEDKIVTAGQAFQLIPEVDRNIITADGSDLSFISVRIADKNGNTIPLASNSVKFSITGAGEVIATDNGDPNDMTLFTSSIRRAFNGWVLCIVRSIKGKKGKIIVNIDSDGMKPCSVILNAR